MPDRFHTLENLAATCSRVWKRWRGGLLLLILGGHAVYAADTIRVMTFNLRYASAGDGENAWENANQSPDRRQVAREAILHHLPHLIGFQEGEDVQLDYLTANLPAFFRIERQKPSGGGGIENAAFAYDTNVLELVDRGVFSLGNRPGGGYWNNPPGTPFDPWDIFPENQYAFPRLALWGRFLWKPTGQTFVFYTTHFDVYNGANGGTSQVKSAAMIVNDARARTERMPLSPLAIAVGDFNGSQNDRAWQLFTGAYSDGAVTGDFTDSWQEAHGTFDHAGTFHGFAGGVQPAGARIDWILHRGGFTATQAVIAADAIVSTNMTTQGTHTLYASDHYPVVAELRFPPVAADHDRDGLTDAQEFASPRSSPADPDSDDDGLLDGEEDLNGNGVVDGGESDPANGTDTQRPTDIREFQLDGIRDHRAALLASNGLELHARFDGRYLYVATYDAGEGNDHFIFIATNPAVARPAPWAKSGQVGLFAAYLADENDGGFSGWLDASSSLITNPFAARAATYYENGGSLEGVIDLAQVFGAGFTSAFYLAAAPYPTADGGALYAPAQVPAGNGDGDILGFAEYMAFHPGDLDGDGISDAADPDRDGDGLPDAWEAAHGLDPDDASGDHGATGDADDDGVANGDELRANTSPSDASDALRVRIDGAGNQPKALWPEVYGTRYVQEVATNLAPPAAWTPVATNTGAVFPSAMRTNAPPSSGTASFIRVRVE